MATKVLLGIGNPLKGDDGVGPYIAQQMEHREGWLALDCGPMPENFAGRITRLEPPAELVVLVDAATMGQQPGELRLVPSEKVDDMAMSTHSMPLSLLMGHLANKVEQVVLIGIEPLRVATGEEGLSEPVQDAAERLTEMLGKGTWAVLPILD